MADSLTTKFENALIDLIERYVEDGLTNADIRGVLDARRDDDHEYRDPPEPPRDLITPPTPEQEAYLKEIERAGEGFDPKKVIGGPR